MCTYFPSIAARFNKLNVINSVTFGHAVTRVEFDEKCKKFRVHVTDVKAKVEKAVQVFDQVIVASGHFSTPNMPSFPGIDSFPGRVFHSHDFRYYSDRNKVRGSIHKIFFGSQGGGNIDQNKPLRLGPRLFSA